MPTTNHPDLGPLDPRLKAWARENRKSATLSEDYLWRGLRGRRLEGLKFRRQHIIEPFIVDFFCSEHRLVVEIDGDIHDLPEVKNRDVSRQQELERQGYRIIRVRSDDVVANLTGVLTQIAVACGIENPRI
ncbi:MAG TPA: endonuclease domain-containing protein [Candidatus Kapabacteria bacterium]|nr:endonuclease domain-containing protein [Candidatus Kapabacteria bacterium]